MDESLAKIRHERSKRDYPGVSFREDEYVEYAFFRAKICLWGILIATFVGLVIILLAFLFVLLAQEQLDDMGRRFLFIVLFSLLGASIIICLVAVKIYKGNRLFITNKRAIQLIMNTIVSSSVNVIDLSSIEDASFRQDTILQRLFHYGTLRLATVGDETTYTFKYSDISPEELKGVSKLISIAKKSMQKDN
ncbi:PH domain-containing protein [Candidatus Saccharibacteria bacterium]|nr:PH domain-containing protein [Candidatus Saccharibacteria bacterium]